MNQSNHKAGDLVCAPQASMLWSEGTAITLKEPTLLLVAKDTEEPKSIGIQHSHSAPRPAASPWCSVVYEGRVWNIEAKDLYEPRRKDGDKTC
jgi:hypothetical protein